MIRRLIARLRATAWDLDMAGYVAGVAGLLVFLAAITGVLGPTLDRLDQLADDGCGKTAYAVADTN